MASSVHVKALVLTGHRVVIQDDSLPEGAEVEGDLLVKASQRHSRKSILEVADSVEPGPRPFKTWEEMDRFLRSERDAWDR